MRHGIVIIEQVALGVAFGGEENFVEVGELEGVSVEGERGFVRGAGADFASGSGRFAMHFARPHIVAQAQKHRRAEMFVGGPVAELHLATSSGRTQVTSLTPRGRLYVGCKGRARGDERLQAGAEIAQGLRGEAGADVSGPDQLAVLVKTQHQRAEGIAFALGESADEELLLVDQFDFEPLAAAPRFVAAGGVLGDDAFEAVLAGGGEQLFA